MPRLHTKGITATYAQTPQNIFGPGALRRTEQGHRRGWTTPPEVEVSAQLSQARTQPTKKLHAEHPLLGPHPTD